MPGQGPPRSDPLWAGYDLRPGIASTTGGVSTGIHTAFLLSRCLADYPFTQNELLSAGIDSFQQPGSPSPVRADFQVFPETSPAGDIWNLPPFHSPSFPTFRG